MIVFLVSLVLGYVFPVFCDDPCAYVKPFVPPTIPPGVVIPHYRSWYIQSYTSNRKDERYLDCLTAEVDLEPDKSFKFKIRGKASPLRLADTSFEPRFGPFIGQVNSQFLRRGTGTAKWRESEYDIFLVDATLKYRVIVGCSKDYYSVVIARPADGPAITSDELKFIEEKLRDQKLPLPDYPPDFSSCNAE